MSLSKREKKKRNRVEKKSISLTSCDFDACKHAANERCIKYSIKGFKTLMCCFNYSNLIRFSGIHVKILLCI